MEFKIYFFSGTGNAKNASNWIKETAEQNSVATELVDVGKLEDRKHIITSNEDTIGFISPTHGFNYPPIFVHFLCRMPKGKGRKAFLMNTRAGMKAGKLFIPGLSGIALLFAACVLWIKGYKIVGMRSLDLPSNWISLHPGLKEKVCSSIYTRRKKQTQKFAEVILAGGKNFRALYAIVPDLLISSIAILYYVFARFAIAKTFIASSNCSKCKLCRKQCPVNAIKWVDNRPFWKYNCESCMQCMNSCPERAIETAHGFILGIIVLVKSVVLFSLYNRLPISEFFERHFPSLLSNFIMLLLNTIIYIFIFLLSYYVLHYLMRIKVVEQMIVYTSLTKYKFWRRYRVPKIVSDL